MQLAAAARQVDRSIPNGAPQAPADLIRFDFLQLSVPTTDAQELCFMSNGQKETIQPRPAFLEVDSTEAMIRALESGMGIGILPAFAARQSLKEGTLVHLLSDYQLQELNLYAIYAGRDFIDAKIKAFIRTLRRLMP
ncbi:LysR substrate-binding domain-containing protein [Pseudomonas putida]|uniref:LysR substrate-binding domain-containing protein n=1 Tax=Pseudomonas putida TaxID=303 RepID=UPI0020CE316B|nr:LysR substrate-binding domain-containing protein [Pseudomonas putida]